MEISKFYEKLTVRYPKRKNLFFYKNMVPRKNSHIAQIWVFYLIRTKSGEHSVFRMVWRRRNFIFADWVIFLEKKANEKMRTAVLTNYSTKMGTDYFLVSVLAWGIQDDSEQSEVIIRQGHKSSKTKGARSYARGRI